jgi:hypothetical protein
MQPEGNTMNMKTIEKKVKHEALELVPPTVFFLVTLHILALTRALMLRQYGLSVSAVAGVTVGALVAAKVVLLADLLPFINRFPDRPLIYNIVWKTAIYVAAALVIHFLEEFIPVWWRMRDMGGAMQELLEKMVWARFWVLQIWAVVLLTTYCTAREVVRAIGPREIRRMIFGGAVESGA